MLQGKTTGCDRTHIILTFNVSYFKVLAYFSVESYVCSPIITTLNLLSVTSFSVQCPNLVSSRIMKYEAMKKLTVVQLVRKISHLYGTLK